MDDQAKRFYDKVMTLPWSGCWIWMGAGGRYGELTIARKKLDAHRVSWLMHRGEIPSGLCVCHSCDQPMCVNPDHLFLGTHRQNTQDMIKKGRHRFATWNAPIGENHWKRRANAHYF